MHEELSERLLAKVDDAVLKGQARNAASSAMDAMLEFAHDEPDHMRFLADETLGAVRIHLGARDESLDRLVRVALDRQAEARADDPSPDLPLVAWLGGVHRLLGSLLRRGQRDFARLAGELRDMLSAFDSPTERHRWHELTPGPSVHPSSHVSELPLQPPTPMPSGRSSQTQREIEANHRQRLLFATAEVAVQKGYHAATVADITSVARVDRRVFYTNFRDKQQAFVAAHELAFQQAIGVSASAFFSAQSWPERIWEGIRATTQFYDTYPVFSHVGFVEGHAVGPSAIQQIEDNRMAFTIFLQEGNQHAERPRSRTAMEAIASTIFEAGYRHARSRDGQAWHLSRMTPLATYIALAPFIGAHDAQRFVSDRTIVTPSR